MTRLLNETILEQLSEMDSPGQKPVIGELIAMFVSTCPGRLKDLGEAINSADWKSAKFLVHSLKNSSELLGADTLSELFASIEEVLENSPNSERLLEIFVKAEDVYSETCKSLEIYQREIVDGCA